MVWIEVLVAFLGKVCHFCLSYLMIGGAIVCFVLRCRSYHELAVVGT
jgi:hypothetical protein